MKTVMRLEMQLKRRPLESTETVVLNLNNLMPYGTYNFLQIVKGSDDGV
jgi:hypothetical protein